MNEYIGANTNKTFGQLQTSSLAIASMVLSCLSLVVGPLGCLPGIICGHLARRQIKNNSALKGNGLAIGGILVGYIWLAIFVALVVLYVSLDVVSCG